MHLNYNLDIWPNGHFSPQKVQPFCESISSIPGSTNRLECNLKTYVYFTFKVFLLG